MNESDKQTASSFLVRSMEPIVTPHVDPANGPECPWRICATSGLQPSSSCMYTRDGSPGSIFQVDDDLHGTFMGSSKMTTEDSVAFGSPDHSDLTCGHPDTISSVMLRVLFPYLLRSRIILFASINCLFYN